jgi:hypothetical protein
VLAQVPLVCWWKREAQLFLDTGNLYATRSCLCTMHAELVGGSVKLDCYNIHSLDIHISLLGETSIPAHRPFPIERSVKYSLALFCI